MVLILRRSPVTQRERQKKLSGLLSKTTTLHVHHTFLYISLASLQDYDVKLPNFTSTTKTTIFDNTRQPFSFSFPELQYSPLEFNSIEIL